MISLFATEKSQLCWRANAGKPARLDHGTQKFEAATRTTTTRINTKYLSARATTAINNNKKNMVFMKEGTDVSTYNIYFTWLFSLVYITHCTGCFSLRFQVFTMSRPEVLRGD